MERATIGLLGADEALGALLERLAHTLPPFETRVFPGTKAALAWMRGAAEETVMLVLGPDAEGAVRVAESAVTSRGSAAIVICARPSRYAALAKEIRCSVLLGDAARCLSMDEPEAIGAVLGEALERAARRRRHRGVVSAATTRLAHAAPPSAAQRAGYVEEIWRHAPIGVLIVEAPCGRVLDCNAQASSLLGMAGDGMLGEHFSEEARHELFSWLADPGPAAREPSVMSLLGGAFVEVRIAAGSEGGTRLVLLHDVTARRRAEEELSRKLTVIEEQRAQIEQLSTPIIQVWDGVLCLPVIGVVDAERAARMTEALLHAVTRAGGAYVVVDFTGVPEVSVSTADGLVSMVRAAALLGATCVLSGISARMARAVVELGLDLQRIKTFPSLHAALRGVLRGR
jgi:anti-anti-sigma regulatory factor/PAS domain-containing protein